MMTRWLRTTALGLVFGGAALAADPPESLNAPQPATPTTIDAPAPGAAERTFYLAAPTVAAIPGNASSQNGRRKLEAQLQAPAGLDFGKRPHVTAKDILDQLHELHHLSFRLDVPTLASLFGTGSATPNKCQVAGQTLPGASYGAYYAPVGAELSPGIAPAQATYSPGLTPPSPAPAAATPSTAVAPPVAPAATGPSPVSSAPASPAAPTATHPSAVASAPAPAAAAAAPAVAPSSINNGSETKPGVNIDAEPKSEPQSDSPAETDPLTKSKSENAPETKGSLAGLLDVAVDVQTIDLKNVSIATVLRHALDAVSPPAGYEELGGMPIPITNAVLLDYLVEDDGLLITTRMRALTHKETRVYSVKHLPNLPGEQLSKVVRQSVRPWSWRAQITDMGDQLKGTPLPAEALGDILKTGALLLGSDLGATLSIADATASPAVLGTGPGAVVTAEGASPIPAQKERQSDDAKAAAMLGNVAVNGLVTFIQATLASLEMFHYAEPPTATIQSLPGKLVITQSQTAHREIAELLEQLAEE